MKKKAGLSKRKLLISNSIVFVVVFLLLIFGIRNYFHLGDIGFTNDAQVDGFVTPISAKVQGFVQEVCFEEHQKINKGDTLIRLDDRELKIALEQADALCQDALAAKDLTLTGIHKAKSNLSVVQAQMDAAKARLRHAEQTYERYKNLLPDEVVTQMQYDQVKSEYDAQKAQYTALKGQYNYALLSVEEAEDKLAMNDVDIKKAEAALHMAQLHLSYACIVAPYDAIAGRKQIQTGQLIQPGQTLLSIVKSKDNWVVANFLEKQLGEIRVGQKVSIKVDALDGKLFAGEVTAIAGASGSLFSSIPVDNASGNFVKVQQRFPVRIDFSADNSDTDLLLLRAGMNVEVEVED